jgi:hypothetical protein
MNFKRLSKKLTYFKLKEQIEFIIVFVIYKNLKYLD